MTGRAVATLLRHRPPALLLETILDFDGGRLVCSGRAVSWRWAELLEAAAQTAGLLAGLQQAGVDNTAVIAEYRQVVVHAARHEGPVAVTARLDRRLLQFWRCRCEVRAGDGALLLAADVTVAPGSAA